MSYIGRLLFSASLGVLLSAAIAVAAPVECGTHSSDPAKQGRIRIDELTVTDGMNFYYTYCVDDIFFEGEIVRMDGTKYPFGKCVYDRGANKDIITYDDQNKFKEIQWVNVDVDGSGMTLADLPCGFAKWPMRQPPSKSRAFKTS
jgi:hypothetical protein